MSVVCMDKKTCPLLDETKEPLLMRPVNNQRIDSEYARNGTCSIFAFAELGVRHHVMVREQRTTFDWTEGHKYLIDIIARDKQPEYT